MVLVFTPRTHRLESITVGTCSSDVILTYSGHTLVDQGSVKQCRDVVDCFPPTTLGIFDDRDHSYTMMFKTGVAIKFEIDPREFSGLKARKEHPVGTPDRSPNIRSISVTSPADRVEAGKDLPRFEVIPNEGVRFTRPGQSDSSWIELGAGLQEVLSALGPPDDSHDNFYNFFSLGIDVKFNKGKFCSVEKLIIHSNQPGHIHFGRYNRAWFDVIEQSKRQKNKAVESSGPNLNNEATLQDLISRFGEPGAPLVVNSPHSAAVQYFYTFKKGLTFELTPCGSIAGVEVSAQ